MKVNQVLPVAGEDADLNRLAIYDGASYARLTASGAVKTSPGVLIGFFINSTSGGTITLYDQVNAGAPQISGTLTPAVGWHEYPAKYSTALWAAIGGTLDVTFIYK